MPDQLKQAQNGDYETYGMIRGLLEAWVDLNTAKTTAEIKPETLSEYQKARIEQLRNLLSCAFIIEHASDGLMKFITYL